MAGFKDDKAGETCPTNRLIGLLLVLVLANVWVHHARKSNNENGFERTRVRGTPIPSLPPAEEEHDDFQEWHSAWELNHPSIIRDCKPIEDMMMAAENSGKAPLEGKVLGYEKKPGKNGLGDRLKAIIGMAVVSMGMERPMRISVKPDAFDFVNVLRQPKSVPIPWHCPWERFDTERRKDKHNQRFRCVPDESQMEAYNKKNKTMFYSAEGGDRLVDGWWLEKYMATKGKGPKTRGDWGRVAGFCIMRALFRPRKDILEQMKMDIQAVATLPLGSTFGQTPDTLLLGVHARYVGRNKIESGSIRLTDEDIQSQIKCSWDMSFKWAQQMSTVDSNTPRQVVWLIASDNPVHFFAIAKKYAQQHAGEMPNGVAVNVAHSTAGKVRHIKFDTSQPTMFRMWLDWFLLSEANACSFGSSGFPETACRAAPRRFLSHGKSMIGYNGCGDWQDSSWNVPEKEKTFEDLRWHDKAKGLQCPIIY